MKRSVLFLILSIFLGSFAWAGPSCGAIFTSENRRGEGDITLLRPLSRGNFEAVIGNERVFLKKLRPSSNTELMWLQKINSLGLGVELYGTVKIQDQNYAVLEFFEGVNTQIPMMAPANFILSKTALSEMQRQAAILAENQIIPTDLQFQVSLDGQAVKIVDPELFKEASSLAEARSQTANILNGIKLPWMMEGKLEP